MIYRYIFLKAPSCEEIKLFYFYIMHKNTVICCISGFCTQFMDIGRNLASVYIAMHLTPDEVQRSPLRRVLPRRSPKGGMRPGVSANPKKIENWIFPEDGMSEHEERLIVATTTQIGVLVSMNTHQYSFNGQTYLQQSGVPIG